MKRNAILLMVLVLFLPLFFNSDNLVVVEAIQEETNQEKTITPTAAAVDFTIIDVDSRIAYNLSDFLGKVVLIDLWATWCGPCVVTIPYLRALYNRYYTRDLLQIISVDVDVDESDALVSIFRESYGMNWIVGIDYNETIWAEYGNIYIPQFYIVDPSGNIVWDHIGSDNFWPDVLEKLQLYLPDDITDPVLDTFSFELTDTEFSIFSPSIDVYANITDDRYVNSTTLIVETSDETLYFDLHESEISNYFEVDETVEFLPTMLYGESQINITFEAKDMWGNTIQSSVQILDVTEYVDTESPTIEKIIVKIAEVDEKRYTAGIFAAISDDLMVIKAKIQLLDSTDSVVLTKNFEPYNVTHMKATFANLLYDDGQPHEFTFKIIVTDVAGKTSEYTAILIDDSMKDTNATFTVSVIVLITFGCLVFRKKRR